MKIILIEDVTNLGKAGEVLEVKRGHYRNYLFPRKLAVEASSKNVKALDHQKRLLDDKIAIIH